jgi:fructose-1-phosphate kinase PfkB-like protein
MHGHPHVLKVNAHEIAVLAPDIAALGVELAAQRGELARGLLHLVEAWQLEVLVVTVGADGALLAQKGSVWWARPPSVPVVNTAGAGDALGAGLMWARSQGMGWPDAFCVGTAAAASVTAHEGTAICERAHVAELVARVDLRQIDARSGAVLLRQPNAAGRLF